MAIEQTAELDEHGRPLNPQTNKPERTRDKDTRAAGAVDWQGMEGETPTPDWENKPAQTDKPERGVEIARSARPDERDEDKVERLAAPDWRSEQPLPSARNALDPRGENTPHDFYETDPDAHDSSA